MRSCGRGARGGHTVVGNAGAGRDADRRKDPHVLLDSGTAGLSRWEMALMFASRAAAYAEVIEPSLAAGSIVLL